MENKHRWLFLAPATGLLHESGRSAFLLQKGQSSVQEARPHCQHLTRPHRRDQALSWNPPGLSVSVRIRRGQRFYCKLYLGSNIYKSCQFYRLICRSTFQDTVSPLFMQVDVHVENLYWGWTLSGGGGWGVHPVLGEKMSLKWGKDFQLSLFNMNGGGSIYL